MNTTIKTLALFIATFSSFSTLAINYSNVNYQDIESLRSALNNVVNSHTSRDAARAALNKMSPDSLEQAKLSIKDPQVRNVMDQLLEGVPENNGSLQAPNTKTTAVITSDASTPISQAVIDNSSNRHALNPNAIAQVTVSNQGWTQNNYRQGYDRWSGDVQSTRPAVSASQMKMDASTAQQNTISENKQNTVAQLDQRDAVSHRLSAQAKEQITHNLRFNNLTASKLEGQIQQADRENSEHEAAMKGEALTKANQQRTRQQVLAGGVAEVNAEMQREAQIRGEALTKANQQRTRQQVLAGGVAEVNAEMQREAQARGEALTKANQQRTRQQVLAGGVAEVNAEMQREAQIRGEALTKANQQRTRQQVLAGGVAEVNAEIQREAQIRGEALTKANQQRTRQQVLAGGVAEVNAEMQREAQIRGEALTKANQQRTRQQVLAGGVAEVNAEMQREAKIKGAALAQSNRDRVDAENTALNAARTASLAQHEAAAAETANLAAQKSQAADKAQREAQQAQAALTSAKSAAAAKAQAEAKAAALAAQNALKTPVVGQPTPVSIVPAVVTNIPTPVIAKVFLTEGSHNNGGHHKGPHQNAASTRNNGNSNAHGSAMGGRGQGGQRSGHSAAGNF
ncbi:hypothetical protein ACF2G4_21440 (plasmid) [Pantoea sp. C3]|uniref:hypothetical protein n=1 Tax=Pantoea phytostimulans TaxID=2769024 RepID=UPI0038F7A760